MGLSVKPIARSETLKCLEESIKVQEASRLYMKHHNQVADIVYSTICAECGYE